MRRHGMVPLAIILTTASILGAGTALAGDGRGRHDGQHGRTDHQWVRPDGFGDHGGHARPEWVHPRPGRWHLVPGHRGLFGHGLGLVPRPGPGAAWRHEVLGRGAGRDQRERGSGWAGRDDRHGRREHWRH